MRRYLVLSDDARGHPFRRTLPPMRVVKIADQDSDVKLFVLSFTAFFVCFYTFLI